MHAEYVDVLQIPAFSSSKPILLLPAAANTGAKISKKATAL
jgi:3-deoxy-D-manno-octulosonic acid (KDO) 8-phosphate synthase